MKHFRFEPRWTYYTTVKAPEDSESEGVNSQRHFSFVNRASKSTPMGKNEWRSQRAKEGDLKIDWWKMKIKSNSFVYHYANPITWSVHFPYKLTLTSLKLLFLRAVFLHLWP